MKQTVQRLIHESFPTHPIVAPEISLGTQQMVMHLEEILLGRSWDTVSVQEYRKCSDGLSLLSAAGLYYYLPGYLSTLLIDEEAADVIPECITFALAANYSPWQEEQLKEMGKWITPNQIAAIGLWLGYFTLLYGYDDYVRRSYITLGRWEEMLSKRNTESSPL